MQTNWDEKYLTQVGYFSHLIERWKVPQSGETSHLGEVFHLIKTALQYTLSNSFADDVLLSFITLYAKTRAYEINSNLEKKSE